MSSGESGAGETIRDPSPTLRRSSCESAIYGEQGMNPLVKEFARSILPEAKTDLFMLLTESCFL